MMMSEDNSEFQQTRGILPWLLSLMIVVLLAACGQKEAPTPPPPPKVTVSQPIQRTVTDFLELTGNSQALNTVQLVARVAGYLEKTFFDDGQLVKKGQLLFLIQQNTYEARLRQAEGQILSLRSQLNYAQSQLIRFSRLLPNKAASQSDVENWRNQRDTAQANLKTAEAQRDLAQLDLSYTKITAPFDGRIDRRLKDPGNLVGAGENTILAEVSQIDPIDVYFSISDVDLARLMESAGGLPGKGLSMKWPIFMGLGHEEGYPHQGKIDFAAITLTPTTGTLLMRGEFPNPGAQILPGLYSRVKVPLKERMAFLLPDAAIGNDQQGSYVLIVNEKNVVERRGVKSGSLVDNLRATEEGLEGKEWVIVKGFLRAAPGRLVTPERESLSPAATPSEPILGKVKP
jgi:RND family efflux transporter MFP subunit